MTTNHSPSSKLPSPHSPQTRWNFSADVIFLLVLLALLGTAIYLYIPRILYASYTLVDEPMKSTTLPISFDAKSKPMTVTVNFNLSIIQPRVYTIRADDCLTSLIVNDAILHTSMIEPCIVDRPKDFPIGGLLYSGENTIIATVRDTGGRQGFSFAISSYDPLFFALRLGVAMTLLALFYLLFRRTKFGSINQTMIMIMILAAGIRMLYFDVTQFDMRGNDTGGHIQYIKFVTQHWSIPPMHSGWQFYQPPLYYFLSASLFYGLGLLNMSEVILLRMVQVQSVVLSLGLLFTFVVLADRLFEQREHREKYLWLFLLSMFPSLILMGVQINNDILLLSLACIAITCLLYFWQTLRLRFWYAAMILIGLGILTKSNAVLLVPAAVCTMLFATSVPFRKRLIHLLLGCLVLLNINASLYMHRYYEDEDLPLVGNVIALHSALIVPNNVSDYITFNPVSVVRDPYVAPWGGEVRSHFFEFYYKTAFFGEDRFANDEFLARILLVLHFVVITSFIIGLLTMRTREWNRSAPILFVLIFLIAGHMGFRYLYPYASSQHFRYTAAVLIPLLYYAVRGAGVLPPPYRSVIRGFLWASGIASAFFIISISIA